MKNLQIQDILSLLIVNLKENLSEKQGNAREFIDKEIFPALKLVLEKEKAKIKTKLLISLMKLITNYKSETVKSEFLPFFISYLRDKNLYQNAEEVIYTLSFLDFCSNFEELGEILDVTKKFLTENYLENQEIFKKIEENSKHK